VLRVKRETQAAECADKCCALAGAFISKQQNVEHSLVTGLVNDIIMSPELKKLALISGNTLVMLVINEPCWTSAGIRNLPIGSGDGVGGNGNKKGFA
jgi:hypothetical protein